MYKLMIVDDEQAIRQGMANGIPWEEWGYEVIAQASDGVEAMELIAKNKPDVVLSDIRMPRMDGVELMYKINEKYPEIKVIILSGYSDFEYLSAAIKNNIMEYLLKPTDIDEFEETFKRIKTKIDKERTYYNKFERSKSYYLESVLNTMLLGYLDEEIMEPDRKLIEEFGIKTDNCVIAMLYIEWQEDIKDESAIYKRLVNMKDCCNTHTKELENQCRFFIAQSDKIAAILSNGESELQYESCVKDFKYIARTVSTETGERIYVCVGRLCRDRLMIPQSYEQALCVAHQKKFYEENDVIVYREVNNSTVVYKAVNFDYKRIHDSIMQNNREMLHDEIDRVFGELDNSMVNNYQYVEMICLELMFYLSQWSMSYNINFEQVMNFAGIRYEDIRKTMGLDNRKKIILTVVDGLFECVEQCMSNSGKSSNLARIIKECVDSEYMNNFMSLEYVAGKVDKSATYVSKLFKDEFGCNFSEYITKRRLEASKEMLMDPRKKIYEIARMCGYADVSNFIKVFKKMYGISPGDYRVFMQR